MSKTPKKAPSMDPAETAAAKGRFLAEYGERGRVDTAAKAAGIGRSTVYGWRKADEKFAAHFEETRKLTVEALEDEAYRRAKYGTKKPVYQQGQLVGHVREYSDVLLIFLLKANNPAKYRDSHPTPNAPPADAAGGGLRVLLPTAATTTVTVSSTSPAAPPDRSDSSTPSSAKDEESTT